MFDESFWIALCFIIFVFTAYKPGKRITLSYLDDRIQSIQLHLYKLQEHNKQARTHLAKIQKQLLSYRSTSKQMLADAEHNAQGLAKARNQELMNVLQMRRRDMQLAITLRAQEAERKLAEQTLTQAIALTAEYLKANPDVIPSSTLLIKRLIAQSR